MEQDLPGRARLCYQCGSCAGGCPVGKWQWDFNPRRFIDKILREELGDIIKDRTIWLCASCHTCLERCPQKIEVSELMVQLKNAAARSGNIPENEIRMGQEIMKKGWLQEAGKRILQIRQEMGLPELPEGIGSSALQDMAHHLGWKEKMEGIKKTKPHKSEDYGDGPVSMKKKAEE
jgi:heterodisulfide reductase subunit C